MTPGTLFPAFFGVDYHSAYGPHKMALPCTEWFPTSITGVLGSFAGWNSTPIDAEAMINALLDKVKVLHLSTTIFDLATIYTMASPTSPAIAQAGAALTQIGTSTSSAQAKAVQNVFVFRAAGGSKLKLYLLDSPTIGGAFEKIPAGAWNTSMNDIFDEIKADGNAWATRQGFQVTQRLSVTSTMNEKLRQEYRMT